MGMMTVDDVAEDATEPVETIDYTCACVALAVDPGVAAMLTIPGGVEPDEMHITLAVVDSLDGPRDVDRLNAAVSAFALIRWPLAGTVGGTGIFPQEADTVDEDTDMPAATDLACGVALIDVPGLGSMRDELVEWLNFAGFSVLAIHDFMPHITRIYGTVDEVVAAGLAPKIPIQLGAINVMQDDELSGCFPLWAAQLDACGILVDYQSRPLREGEPDSPEPFPLQSEDGDWPVMKAAGELQMTTAPVYVPGRLDLHGDWADAEDLQKAVLDYVASGDRGIRLQHMPQIQAGTMVATYITCTPMIVPMTVGGSVTKMVELPAGTVMQDVLWTDWAWSLVKSGKIRGMSFGGTAGKVAEAPVAA